MDDLHQFLRGDGAGICAAGVRIDHVLADMVLDDFSDEAVESPATGCRLLQNVGTFSISFDRARDGVQLAAQAFDPVQELALLFRDVIHYCYMLI
jgi:hypothetical protein